MGRAKELTDQDIQNVAKELQKMGIQDMDSPEVVTIYNSLCQIGRPIHYKRRLAAAIQKLKVA